MAIIKQRYVFLWWSLNTTYLLANTTIHGVGLFFLADPRRMILIPSMNYQVSRHVRFVVIPQC